VLLDDDESELDNMAPGAQERINLRSKTCFDNFTALAENAHNFPGGQRREEALWRTLCSDETGGIPPGRALPEYFGAYRVVRNYNTFTAADGRIDVAAAHESVVLEDYTHYTAFINKVGEHCAGRNLCVTEGATGQCS
jgi:hypothetical protein